MAYLVYVLSCICDSLLSGNCHTLVYFIASEYALLENCNKSFKQPLDALSNTSSGTVLFVSFDIWIL